MNSSNELNSLVTEARSVTMLDNEPSGIKIFVESYLGFCFAFPDQDALEAVSTAYSLFMEMEDIIDSYQWSREANPTLNGYEYVADVFLDGTEFVNSELGPALRTEHVYGVCVFVKCPKRPTIWVAFSKTPPEELRAISERYIQEKAQSNRCQTIPHYHTPWYIGRVLSLSE